MTARATELLRQYMEMRHTREREDGPLTDAQRSEEARESARTAMSLAGQPDFDPTGESPSRADKIEVYEAWRDDPERLRAVELVNAPGRRVGHR